MCRLNPSFFSKRLNKRNFLLTKNETLPLPLKQLRHHHNQHHCKQHHHGILHRTSLVVLHLLVVAHFVVVAGATVVGMVGDDNLLIPNIILHALIGTHSSHEDLIFILLLLIGQAHNLNGKVNIILGHDPIAHIIPPLISLNSGLFPIFQPLILKAYSAHALQPITILQTLILRTSLSTCKLMLNKQ